jgi:polyketide synthase PksN
LGDPIEVEGLKNAFKKYTRRKGYCALGSVKSNIGHCLTAAGIAGTLKLILALKSKQLPPTINFERVNEHIDLTDSPFYVNTRLQEWELQGADRRQAAISSFGFSGTNAHVVIGEYTPSAEVKRPVYVATQNTKAIIPLSAKTAEQLKQKARDLLDFIHQAQSIDLIEMAYTLQVGRQPMDQRLGFVASSIRQLAEKLQAYLAGEQGIEESYQGQALHNNDTLSLFSTDVDLQHTIGRWIANKKLSMLLGLWVKGLEVDWSKLYGEVKPRRISLPTYPFAKERYWIERGAAREKAIGALLAAPVWRESDVEVSAGASHIEYAEHRVVLCELSDVNQLKALLPHVYCLSLQAERQKNIAQRYSEYALACFELIQTILQDKPHGKALVQIVVPDHQEQALFAGLSGLLKTAALENPQFVGQLLLVSAGASLEELVRRLREEKTHGPAAGLDTPIRYENGGWQVLGWQEVPEEQEKPPIAFRDHCVYLITGGMGGLGLLFAREILAETRDARVVLTGRSALSAEKQALLDGLSAQAGRVSYRQVDVSDLDQVTELIAAIKGEYGQLNGILHCAGVIADNFILKKTSAQFSEVLAPKVAGVFNLDQASRDVDLDFFALFSSIASALGNLGQADYATANGFMDQFAAYRNRQVIAGERRGRTLSINWPLWKAGGMTLDPASQELMRQTTGMRPMKTATGLRAFYRGLAAPYDQMLVVEGALPRITAHLQKSRMFEAPSQPAPRAIAGEAPGEWSTPGAPLVTARSTDYANAEPEEAVSLDHLQRQLKAAVAAVLRIEMSIIDVDQPFVEFGLDSFLGAELLVAINRKYGTTLSHIILFDYPTVREFSLFLEKEIKKSPGYSIRPPAALPLRSPAPAASPYPVLTKRICVGQTTASSQTHLAHSDDKIAIVGMSGRYPQASNLKQYWDNLVEGKNSIVEVPASRWDVNRYYDPDRAMKDKTNSKWIGALDDIDCFDPLFFRISPHEAEHMDPQHRLFLQECYKAFEDAGYSSNSLSNKKCGVYLGISTNEYMSLLLRNGIVSAPVTSNSYAIAAARIAYYLNLKGPAMAVDTACSSSLVAIHLASQALSNREIDMALAGGVSLWLTPESYIAMSKAGMFSPAGQCKTFDDTADGIVNGEGVGVLALKRLRDAQEDNDFIYGVILGSGINQDGKTNGITAPSVGSQIELEREIYAKYKIDPETISFVETHGTGTRLGDPIELEALAAVFKEKTAGKNYCGLGSVKSNIGHTTAAAGVAGVQKVLLSMRHRTLVPSLNVSQETSRFDFKNSPFYVVREKQTWDVAPGSLRRAAVSSFGFSGTNAHLVVEEYAPPPDQAMWSGENDSFIVPLSAKTSEQLEERARDLLKFIRASGECGQPAEESTPSSEPIDLAAVAYTLQVGRDSMEERLAFIVSSVDQLAEKLRAYIDGERDIESAYQGRVEPGNGRMTAIERDDDMQEALDRWIARKKFAKVAQSWAGGMNVDWTKLYGGGRPRRVSLPTYPFAKERYWIDEAPVRHGVDSRFEVEVDLKSIDDIMDKICDDAMETNQAVKLLKALV